MKRIGNTRERIIEAARSLIWKHGYAHVTIDAICGEIGIQKGSFYHFFDNKSALADVAFGALWQDYRQLLDRVFSPGVPPLTRLENYLRLEFKKQQELKRKHGCVMGCPFCLLASELSQSDELVGMKARAILKQLPKYLEPTLRDARAEGSIEIRNIPATVRRLSAYIHGCLQQARMQDDLSLLRELAPGVAALIGIEALPSQNRGHIDTPRELALAS